MSDLSTVLSRLEKDMVALTKDRELIEYKLDEVSKKFEMVYDVVKIIEQKLVNSITQELRTEKLEKTTEQAEKRVLDIIERLNKVESCIKEFESNLNAKEINKHIQMVQEAVERIKAIENEKNNDTKQTNERQYNFGVGISLLVFGGIVTFIVEKIIGG